MTSSIVWAQSPLPAPHATGAKNAACRILRSDLQVAQTGLLRARDAGCCRQRAESRPQQGEGQSRVNCVGVDWEGGGCRGEAARQRVSLAELAWRCRTRGGGDSSFRACSKFRRDKQSRAGKEGCHLPPSNKLRAKTTWAGGGTESGLASIRRGSASCLLGQRFALPHHRV